MLHWWASTVLHFVVVLVLAGGANVAHAAEFKQGSYSGTLPRGESVTFKFDNKDKFVLADKDGKTLVEGTYKVMKDEIEFTDEKGPIASKDAKPGKYQWKMDDKKLSFTKVEDESDGRSKGLTSTTWTLEK
jgi:hypothetical protein